LIISINKETKIERLNPLYLPRKYLSS